MNPPSPAAAALLLLLLLPGPAGAGVTCGQKGSIGKRAADCAKASGVKAKRLLIAVDPSVTKDPLGGLDGKSLDRIWRLVALKDYEEVWLDETTGLLWSRGETPEASGTPCQDAHLKGFSEAFRLPAAEELTTALNDGVHNLIQGSDSALVLLSGSPPLYDISARRAVGSDAAKKGKRSIVVRCVAKGAKPKPVVGKKETGPEL